MRFLLRIILVAGLAFLAQSFLPFWSAAIAGFVVGFLLSERKKRRMFGKKQASPRSFFAGFIALFLLWGIMAWMADSANESLLSEKIHALITGGGEPFMAAGYILVLVTAMIGGLIGGFSTLTGNLLGEIVKG